MAVERRIVTNDPTLVEAELRSVVGTVWVPCVVISSDDESGLVLVLLGDALADVAAVNVFVEERG